MTGSLGYIGAYVLVVGVASFIESPVGRGFGPFQLNALIRTGSLVAAVAALVLTHGLAIPPSPPALAGLGIGLLTGVGSLFYCFALDYLSVAMVVTFSNLYIVITTLLGIAVLGERVTVLKIVGLACILLGVVLLAHPPARYAVTPEAARSDRKMVGLLAFGTIAIYVMIIGVGAFLEKPALKGLDATQLNALMAISMTAVAGVALTVRGPRLPMTKRTLGAFGVGAMIGIASVFYFLGLAGLNVSVAAASSNAFIIVTVVLSTIFLRQPLTRARGGAIIVTLFGVTGLALSAG
ncbi:MAG: EamA family transporter [Candidatus Dormiibacterota bacterium]